MGNQSNGMNEDSSAALAQGSVFRPMSVVYDAVGMVVVNNQRIHRAQGVDALWAQRELKLRGQRGR